MPLSAFLAPFPPIIIIMKILYEDHHCRVTDICIIIYRYYFPLTTSKTILYQEVEKIDLVDATEVNHLWGVTTAFMNGWFHLDGERKSKAKYICVKMKNKNIRPCLTPTDPIGVFNILRNHFMEMERKSVAFRSNVDKLTEA